MGKLIWIFSQHFLQKCGEYFLGYFLQTLTDICSLWVRIGLINSFIQKTKLRIWTVDFAESIEGIDENEKQVLKALSKIDGSLSKKELQAETGLSRHYATKSLEKLITADYVLEEGAGRSTRYRLNRTLEQKVATIKQRAADLRITKEIN